MTRTIPLSQFMPYGAPELLAAERGHMTRAVMASSGMAVAALLLAIAVVPKGMIVPPRRITDINARILHDPLPPLASPRDVPRRAEGAPPLAQAKSGDIVPVVDREELVLPEDPVGATPSGVIGGEGAEPVAAAEPTVPIDLRPERGVYRYYDELPVSVRQVKPEYPEIARQAGVDGLVVVDVLVGRDGRVLDAVVHEKASVPLLDDAALDAARRWVFKPAQVKGHPVPAWVTLKFRFVQGE